jgi:hypothetical protein
MTSTTGGRFSATETRKGNIAQMISGQPITVEERAEVIRLYGLKWPKNKIAKHTFMDRGTVAEILIEELRRGKHAANALEHYDVAWKELGKLVRAKVGNEPGQCPASVKVRCTELIFDAVVPPEQKVSYKGQVKIEGGAVNEAAILQLPVGLSSDHLDRMARNARLELQDQLDDFANAS